MEKQCDNTSVGIVLQNERDEILLLNRQKFPYGWAVPAGHIDEHGTTEQAAVNELAEETGIHIAPSALRRVLHNIRVENTCRRMGGSFHVWTVYTASTSQESVHANTEEARSLRWYTRPELQNLADRTRILAEHTKENRDEYLEAIWLRFLVELGYVK